MHRTMTTLYPWQPNKPKETIIDNGESIADHKARIANIDPLASSNIAKKAYYVMGSEGVYEIKKLY